MSATLGILLDEHSDAPLYQQIFDQVVERVRLGALAPGTRMPPTRTLAQALGTTRNTVVRAFEDLSQAGWLRARVGQGTFVCAPPTPPPLARPPRGGLPWSSLSSRAASAEIHRRAERLAVGLLERPCVDLQSMQPPRELLPVQELRRCIDHVLRHRGARVLEYAPAEGVGLLREQLALDLYRHGVPCQPDDLVVTAGSQQGLDLVVRALVDPGDTVLVDRCTYTGLLRVLGAAGAHVATVPGDGDGPDLPSLERLSGAKLLYTMPDGQNPTGASIDRRRREQIVGWSRRAGVPVLEDDYAADLDLDGVSMPPPLRALDGEVIYTTTYSKRLAPALRLGVVVCPPPLRARLIALKRATDLGCSALLQHGFAEFLERGYLRAHLARTLPEYRRRRDALLGALAEHLPDGVEVHTPQRGVTLWIPLPDGTDPSAVFVQAQRRGVLVMPGTLHTPQPLEPSGIRLTFCAEPPERLVEGARRLGEALHAAVATPHPPIAALEGP